MASWSIHDNKELTAKYQILGHIGSGSYADVYRAHRKADGLEVALKEVHDYQSACREIDALNDLVGYPHVVQLLEYLWLSEDSVVLVLEFLCSDLSAVINQRKKQQQPDVIGSSSYAGTVYPGMADMNAGLFHTELMEARSEIWAAAAPITFYIEPGMRGFTSSFHSSSHSMAHDAHDSDASVSEHHEAVRDLANSYYAQVTPNAQDHAMDPCDKPVSPNNKSEPPTDERKQQDAFEEAVVKGWMIQLLKGVASCHAEGFLHRDLKPSNLLISALGVLKIADFGQARILGPQGKVSSLPVVNYSGTISQPELAPDQREPPQDQRRIASLVATFHKETVERRMEVEDAETPPPLIIKGIAELQSQESSLHVVHNTEEKLSKLLSGPELSVSRSATDNETIAEQVPYSRVMGTSFVYDHQADSLNFFGKTKRLHSAIDDKNALSLDFIDEECGFQSGEENESIQVGSHVEQNWTSDDLTRFKWNAGGDNTFVLDQGVSENSAEFGSEVGFYKEEVASEYTGCVGTRWYRAPELLYGATTYGMGVDMWAVGCMFGELLSGKPVFPGCSDIDQLSRIVRVLGNPNEECWPGVSNLPDYGKISFADDRSGYSLRQHIKEGSEEAHDLLSKLIAYNPESRLTAADALKHPYFQVEPHPMAARELRVPSPGAINDDSMLSF